MTAMAEDGVRSREELMNKKIGTGLPGSILFLAAGLVPVSCGFKGSRKPKNKKTGKKRKKS